MQDDIKLYNGVTAPREALRSWINALNSGKFSQTKEVLQDERGYCCLGVACTLLSIGAYATEDRYGISDYVSEEESFMGSFLRGSLPIQEDGAPAWLTHIDDDAHTKTGRRLSTLNDKYGWSFTDIAELLDILYLQGLSVDLSDVFPGEED